MTGMDVREWYQTHLIPFHSLHSSHYYEPSSPQQPPLLWDHGAWFHFWPSGKVGNVVATSQSFFNHGAIIGEANWDNKRNSGSAALEIPKHKQLACKGHE
jgi:hypothetical protein